MSLVCSVYCCVWPSLQIKGGGDSYTLQQGRPTRGTACWQTYSCGVRLLWGVAKIPLFIPFLAIVKTNWHSKLLSLSKPFPITPSSFTALDSSTSQRIQRWGHSSRPALHLAEGTYPKISLKSILLEKTAKWVWKSPTTWGEPVRLLA